jgi:soluble lytic murein transglycosylase-like protein
MSFRPQLLILAGALAMTIVAGLVGIPAASANDRVVIVQPGQTLSQIAAAHGVSVARLVALNDLADPDRIFPGQRLRLGSEPRRVERRTHLITHQVGYGETLTGIAARYRTSITAIARRNGIADPSRIYVGQLLSIAAIGNASGAKAHRASGDERYRRHQVLFGETLSGIALQYRVSLEAIAIANGVGDPSYIRAGDVLRIPGQRRAGGGARDQGATGRRMPPDMAALVADRSGIGRLIAAEARRQHVPREFALAVAWQESGWQPGVVSTAGAIGVMQLLPATGDWIAATMLGAPVNLWDARSNARAGVRLLRHYLDRYGGSRPLALAAYYQGQAATDQHGIYAVSQPYIASILILQEMFRR